MTSAFGYLLDRSVGLPSRAYREQLHSVASRELLRDSSCTSNFIYRQGMSVWSLALDPVEQRYLLVGSSKSQLLVYDLLTLDEAHRVIYNTTNPLEPICAVGTKSKASGTQIRQFGISMVDWYPVDAGLCITSSLDQHVKVWDAERFSCVTTFPLRSKVFGARFSPVSTTHALIAAVTANQEVRLVDMESHATAHCLLGHRDEVWTLDWAPQCEFVLATGSRDGELRLWDIRRSGATACLLCLNYEGKAAIPGRSSVYTSVTQERPMSLTTAATSKKRQRGAGGLERQARDRRRARVDSFSTNIRPPFDIRKRNDPHAAASTSLVVAHTGGIISLVYMPDGRFLLSNGMDGKLRLWNATSGEHEFMNYQGFQGTQSRASRNVQMAVVQEGGAWESTLVFTPNGSDGAVASYQVFGESGAPLGLATAHYQQVTACLYRKSRRELYSAGEDGLIMRWKPRPVDLYPEVPDDVSDVVNTQNRESNAVSSAAMNDVDAWSDDDDEETNHQFIPPILRDNT
ncbi:hypothetical protein PsorP6_011978 [Peronosclerospora sorghi]|uniref:Uncharacterized protein n=1 Tax=Peronosclerospora sorghi TaxID=230839 RepID=A0ACC0WLL2_9STRA|nr:hypothetical protein PsorP6_011978 [Peronosclerospora sorghi]